MFGLVKRLGKGDVVALPACGHARPEVKARVGQLHIQHLGQYGRDLGELGAVLVAVVHHMGFVAPGGHAGRLHHRAHGAAMVGAIEQKLLNDGRVACHEAAAQARYIAALTETGEGDQALEVGAAQLVGGFQSAQRRFVAEINLAVALVRRDHKTVLVRQGKQFFPLRQGHDRTRGVAWRANEQQLGAGPDLGGHAVPVVGKVARRVAGHVIRLGTR